MGKKYVQKFHKRKYINGTKDPEKLFNIFSHEENGNQNHNEQLLHAHENS